MVLKPKLLQRWSDALGGLDSLNALDGLDSLNALDALDARKRSVFAEREAKVEAVLLYDTGAGDKAMHT